MQERRVGYTFFYSIITGKEKHRFLCDILHESPLISISKNHNYNSISIEHLPIDEDWIFKLVTGTFYVFGS